MKKTIGLCDFTNVEKDLASYLGTTPETISRKVLIIGERGLIKQHTQKYVEIFDLDKLLFASS